MNNEEVRALRKAFDSVKERQAFNQSKGFAERTERLISSRELCVGNEVLLEQAIANLKKNGIKVYLAREKQEALGIILNEIGKEKFIVKSKSNVTKELELTKFLEKNGATVVETDIGDRILQILNAKPSHPTGPVTHLSAKQIAKGISKYYDVPVTETPEDIVKIVKEDIVSSLDKAKIGITGANAIAAEEGSIIMTHNEGNIHEVMRKQKHIVVTSIDKIYPDIESAINMIRILCYNATGAIIPSFVDIITSVSKTADVEKKFIKGVHNPSEIVLVLVDNKRSDLAKKGFKELLKCIGCGNCLLHCPMYNTIGNEYAIDSYLGGKGLAYYSVYTNEPNEKLELCLGCGKCMENCPLELDIPDLIRNLRSTGISSEVYYFLKSHIIWVYYQALLRVGKNG
ncbi:MAG: Lactate utilization protein B [Candidatus Methanoperedens nitroreducens]|uniref:Lactate utilization protein B n=1 Tax=Candidatus Methanoperedens nitratireducens TaxID=1392998 RepID=A0A0P8E3H5_9EURY|nr:LUD domain-containing protein [Candidatus Methanoperedens sp. BLZ2]KAB2946194.1 MAG: lactate utilization protein [Candidatus Methanoperedens sp.]KPQ45055.1 MAG: Lactate utilization protein B [Candidatus Methanoperedens sp. BLZ1]MBZ0177639.1 LUD domain-containing protein [Candidatus Methanoperedens nitroreducens]MCX9078131.1 LUD domain-containing protein [Candidatus Methanoperedens sp.]